MTQPAYGPGAAAPGAGGSDLKIYFPLPFKRNPVMPVEELDAYGAAWMLRKGLCTAGSPWLRGNFGLMTSAGFPFFSREVLKATCLMNYWALAWDDHIETLHTSGSLAEVNRRFADMTQVLYTPQGAPAPPDPWAAALGEVSQGFARCLSPQQWERWRAAFQAWFPAALWSEALKHGGELPSVGSYLRMRYLDLGCEVLSVLTPMGSGYDITPENAAHRNLRAFNETMVTIATLYNDLLSMAKEADSGVPNIISLIAHHHACSPLDAIAAVLELHDRLMCLLLRQQAHLIAHGNPAVARYVQEFPYWLSCVLDWAINSPRYLESDGVPTFTLTDAPVRWDPQDTAPPPYPEIAWWWATVTR
ncbi:terpene synthase family protein [Streptomyces sp. NPDC050698]